MLRHPVWKLEVAGIIKKKIREYFPETIINNIIVRELQLDIHRILRFTEFIWALSTVIEHNTLPPRNELRHLFDSNKFRVLSQTHKIVYDIVKKTTIPNPASVTRNVLLISISADYYLRIVMLESNPIIPVPPEWFDE